MAFNDIPIKKVGDLHTPTEFNEIVLEIKQKVSTNQIEGLISSGRAVTDVQSMSDLESVTPDSLFYSRIGKLTTFEGTVTAVPSAGNPPSRSFSINLPFPPDFQSNKDGAGHCTINNIEGVVLVGYVEAMPSNGTVIVVMPNFQAEVTVRFSFTYMAL